MMAGIEDEQERHAARGERQGVGCAEWWAHAGVANGRRIQRVHEWWKHAGVVGAAGRLEKRGLGKLLYFPVP